MNRNVLSTEEAIKRCVKVLSAKGEIQTIQWRIGFCKSKLKLDGFSDQETNNIIQQALDHT